jgi:hypothetical protein
MIATLGLVGLGFDGWASMTIDDASARERGFQSMQDERLATELGVTDPTVWASQREWALAAQTERQAAARRAQEEAEAAEEAGAAADKANDCRKDLRCWGEKALIIAGFKCAPEVERMAQYDVEWTDGFLGQKFTHFRWTDEKAGTVTTLGDKVQFGNAFGAKISMTYECEVNPATRDYSDVRVYPGRL